MQLDDPRVGPPTGPAADVAATAPTTLQADAQRYLHFSTRLDTHVRSQMWNIFVDQSADEVVLYDQQLTCVYVNTTLIKASKVAAETLLGSHVSALPFTFNTNKYFDLLQQVRDTRKPQDSEISWSDHLGQTQYRHIQLIPQLNANEEFCGILSIARDVTSLKEAERKLGEAQVIASISYWEWDYRNNVLSGTKLGREVLGLPGDHLDADEYRSMIPKVECEAIDDLYKKAFKQGSREISYAHGLILSDGSRRELQNWVRLEYGADGRAVRAVGVSQDVTGTIALQKKTHQLAFYDPLTELPNRVLLQEKLHTALAEAATKSTNVGLIMLDIDHFQKVNDSMGYACGDILLKVVGERLSHLMRDSDTVARLGGDEFALILHHVRKSSDVESIVHRIKQLLEIPISLQGAEIIVTASAGVAIYPQDGLQANELLTHADAAMFHAKDLGRNNFQFYDRELTASTQERVQIESDLRKALERGELELFYQPKIDLSNGQVLGAEALMRWRHPTRGLVPPDKFIGIAEETGLIVEMGRWALHSACLTAKEWNAERDQPLIIAVNLSPRQFYTGNLVVTLRNVLEETGARAEWIELEITESLLLNDRDGVSEVLKQMHRMGFSIAIDDFGTGYSSLSYLSHFPVDTLKIDRSFIKDLDNSANSEVLVQAIVALGHSLHMQLVAEGIETTTQRDRLRSYGCHFAQGYLYSKPLPTAEFTALMNASLHNGMSVLPA